MWGTANAVLATEVSKAGGLGIIPAGFEFSPGSPQIVALEKELITARNLLGLEGKPQSTLPVGVGFITCHPSIAHFTATVIPLLRKHKPVAVWLFAPALDLPERPHPQIIQQLHVAGINAIVQVGNVASAKDAIEDGADVVVAQGIDAGGHQFAHNASIVSLVPEIRCMLDTEYPGRDIGLLAAGGISNGRGVAAAIALGAEGVVQGTRFIVAQESTAMQHHQDSVLEATDGGNTTIKSTIHDDIQGTPIWPTLYDGRALVGKSYRDNMSGVSIEENAVKYREALQAGDNSRRITWCGTGIGLVNERLPAGEIVEKVRNEAIAILQHLPSII
ncbi:Fc.00g046400.m01.CDS01 [Cosmosporella sp. VM-42]